jgi:hypothetical protein
MLWQLKILGETVYDESPDAVIITSSTAKRAVVKTLGGGYCLAILL